MGLTQLADREDFFHPVAGAYLRHGSELLHMRCICLACAWVQSLCLEELLTSLPSSLCFGSVREC